MAAPVSCTPHGDGLALPHMLGPLALRYPGQPGGATPEAFAPTNHRPGEHADLWACAECGTVQQAELPAGEQLTSSTAR